MNYQQLLPTAKELDEHKTGFSEGVIFGASKVTELYIRTLNGMKSDDAFLKICPELPMIADALIQQAQEAKAFAINVATGSELMNMADISKPN